MTGQSIECFLRWNRRFLESCCLGTTSALHQLNLEYRLPDDVGVVNLRATGNIGDAVKKGLGIDTSTRLGFLGLPEAIVTTALQLEDSSVRDPILGVDRRLQFHGRGSARIGLRHDVTAHNFNYGIDYRYNFNGGSRRFDRRISDPLPSLIENACTTTGRQYAVKIRTTF